MPYDVTSHELGHGLLLVWKQGITNIQVDIVNGILWKNSMQFNQNKGNFYFSCVDVGLIQILHFPWLPW